MAQIAQEITTIKFSKLIGSDDSPTYVSASDIQTAVQSIASGLFGFNVIVEVSSVANVTIDGTSSIIVSNTAGTGSVATLSFATTSPAPYASGQTILVSGVTPSGYNGTHTVLTCNTTSVTFASATTGNTSFIAGTITSTS